MLVYMLNDITKSTPGWRDIVEKPYKDVQPYIVQRSFLLNTLYFRWKRTRIPEVLNFYTFTAASYRDESIWAKHQMVLGGIKQVVESRGGRLLVVTFPFLHSLGPEYAFAEAHRHLGEFWRKFDVPHLDLLDLFQSHRSEQLTVNRYDAHPNERAHALAAAEILPFLRSHLRAAADERPVRPLPSPGIPGP